MSKWRYFMTRLLFFQSVRFFCHATDREPESQPVNFTIKFTKSLKHMRSFDSRAVSHSLAWFSFNGLETWSFITIELTFWRYKNETSRWYSGQYSWWFYGSNISFIVGRKEKKTMPKSFVGSIVLILSVICFVNGETSVKVTTPQKNPGELQSLHCCVELPLIFFPCEPLLFEWMKLFSFQYEIDHPNKCWDEATQTAFAVGSHNPKDSCQRIHCYPDFRIKYTS